MITFVRVCIVVILVTGFIGAVGHGVLAARQSPNMSPGAHVGNHTSTRVGGGMLISLKDITKTSCIYYGIGDLPDIVRPKEGDTCQASIRVYEVETPTDAE